MIPSIIARIAEMIINIMVVITKYLFSGLPADIIPTMPVIINQVPHQIPPLDDDSRYPDKVTTLATPIITQRMPIAMLAKPRNTN